MLLDNRVNGVASVVVVPTTEWDKIQKAKLKSEIENTTDEGVREEKIMAYEPPEIVPLEGSNLITFSNRTDSNLAGCSAIGDIEIFHKGTMHHAVTVLKNEAYRFNTNVLVPISTKQTLTNAYAPSVHLEARMMRCPIKLARGN